jgi:coenzyme F420-reducing hydrogenase delta subunit
MPDILEHSSWYDLRYLLEGADVIREDVQWLLVNTFLVEPPVPVEDLTPGHEGQVDYLPFLHPVHALFAKNFLTALSLVKPNRTIAPISFKAKEQAGGKAASISSLEASAELGGDGLASAPDEWPPCHECESAEPFTYSDLERLRKVWPPIARLRNLQGWAEEMGSERFSSFGELQEEEARGSTRLGRALLLFEDGIRLPGLHAFLSMWLVLETLYTDGEGEVQHKLAVRLARILCGERFSEREEYFTAAKEAYGLRSDIVHGKDTGKKRQEKKRVAWTNAFRFARESLERILCDEELFDVFTDERKDGTKKKDRISGFFKSLDLGGWELNPER